MFQSKKERAVAPIIATLLMVAIAVVGGILIFVFTQGFFADEQVVGPTVDNIRIFGYDFTDDDTATSYAGNDATCNGGAVSGSLGANDCVIIYVENLGDKPVSIESIRIFGEGYTFVSSGQAAGNFLLQNAAFSVQTDQLIEPNESMNIQIRYDTTDSGTVKMGRTIPIQVETSNGQSSLINVINGAQRGQQ